jgi:negative regulator of flagellin synthesis FlgM
VRIQRAQIGQIIKAYKAQSSSQTLRTGSASSKGISSDSVKLSFNQADLDRLQEQVAALPSLRLDRIKELEQVVQDGTYEADPTEVADRMLGRMIADKIR